MDLAVITSFPPRLTGISQYGLHLCQALARTGQLGRIAVLAEIDGQAGDSAALGPSVEVRRCWRYGHPALGLQLLRGLEDTHCGRAWVNFGFGSFGPSPAALLSALVGLTLAARRGFALLITLHEASAVSTEEAGALWGVPLGRILDGLFRWLIRIGAVAVPLRADAQRLRARFPQAAIVHLPHGSFYPPEALPEPERPSLLFFGSLAPYKGIDLLLEAFRSLRAQHPELSLEIAGAEHPRFPGYAHRLRAASTHLPGIHWLGPVEEATVRALFARNTLVVLPYRQATGPSSVMIRAAAWGRAVVASDLPALRAAAAEADLLSEWIPSRDPAALARAIARLLQRLDLRAHQRQHNLQAIASCTIDIVAQAYARVLEALPALSCNRFPRRGPIIGAHTDNVMELSSKPPFLGVGERGGSIPPSTFRSVQQSDPTGPLADPVPPSSSPRPLRWRGWGESFQPGRPSRDLP